MFKSMEAMLAVWSTIFSVFGGMLVAFARLTTNLLGVAKHMQVLLKDERYMHIAYRMNTVRHLVYLLLIEFALMKKEILEAKEKNPDDFKIVDDFNIEVEHTMKTLSSSFKLIDIKAEAYRVAEAESIDAFKGWIAADESTEDLQLALYGPVIEIDLAEYKMLLEKQYQKRNIDEVQHFIDAGYTPEEATERSHKQMNRSVSRDTETLKTNAGCARYVMVKHDSKRYKVNLV